MGVATQCDFLGGQSHRVMELQSVAWVAVLECWNLRVPLTDATYKCHNLRSIWWVDDHWVLTSRISISSMLQSSNVLPPLSCTNWISQAHNWWCWGLEQTGQPWWFSKANQDVKFGWWRMGPMLTYPFNSRQYTICCIDISCINVSVNVYTLVIITCCIIVIIACCIVVMFPCERSCHIVFIVATTHGSLFAFNLGYCPNPFKKLAFKDQMQWQQKLEFCVIPW